MLIRLRGQNYYGFQIVKIDNLYAGTPEQMKSIFDQVEVLYLENKMEGFREIESEEVEI